MNQSDTRNNFLLPEETIAAITDLARQVGISDEITLKPLKGGKNNRVFKLTTGSKSLLLKQYYRDDADRRDRLHAEYSFLQYAVRHAPDRVPKPLACDRLQGLALYEFIKGERPRPEQINRKLISQALEFFTGINQKREQRQAAELPIASEACFSIKEHLQLVEQRLRRLTSAIAPDDPPSEKAAQLIRHRLAPAWEMLLEELMVSGRDHKTADLEQPLDQESRVISPSDFGFHNAMIRDGRTLFIDFEYAGWDDPAKLVCDFFCQPALPAPIDYFDWFAAEAAKTVKEPDTAIERCRVLLPVYRIKWCCIILNDFLPSEDRRRLFAGQGEGLDRKWRQLIKAEEYFNQWLQR